MKLVVSVSWNLYQRRNAAKIYIYIHIYVAKKGPKGHIYIYIYI